ncbi:MAG: pyridoxal-dependent decarboxylase [Planctomycetota bacterium]|nr:pyridoxal-dependent decarboxylase [Planctomycetota bacterium]
MTSGEEREAAGGLHGMSAEEFRRAGHGLIDWIAEYLEGVEGRRVMPEVRPGSLYDALPGEAPERGEAWESIARDVDALIMPSVTHWQSPDFHGFFPCNNSYPSVLGELLSAGLGINGFLWQCSPAITELEMRVMNWLGKAVGLPGEFLFAERHAEAAACVTREAGAGGGGGVIHGTASEAVLTAMVAARHRVERGGAGGEGALTVYASSQAHSSVTKAAMVAGVGREGVRLIGVDGSLAMRADELERTMRADIAAGRRPMLVCATVGTTSTGAVDPVGAVARAARRAAASAREISGAGAVPGAGAGAGAGGVWVHVDAAFAGAACVCPEHRWLLEGVEEADSFNFNPHKWLLTNFDCSAFWTRDARALSESLSINPEYLRNKASEAREVVDYRDWQVPLGRRFRALKLWFVMRRFGLEGLRAHVREHVRLGELFEGLARGDERFEVPTPRLLSLVCVRLRAGDEATARVLERANASGRGLFTGSVVPIGAGGENRRVIRVAIGATRTRERHVRAAWELLSKAAE